MKNPSYIIILSIIIFLTGCADWALKDRCKATNWFEYSQSVAFDGRYLDEDTFTKECKRVDIISAVQVDQGFKLGREKMCQYDEIFNRAKEGVPVFFKFCDGLEMNLMKSKYRQGLVLFCTADVGYTYGKSGKIYQKVCDANQEQSFLPTYYKGRKEYLLDQIAQAEKFIAASEMQMHQLEKTEAEASANYNTLGNLKTCSRRDVYIEAEKKYANAYVCEEPSYVGSQRNQLLSQLSTLRGDIHSTYQDIKNKQQELNQNKTYLAQIP